MIGKLPPHIFAIADTAFRLMREEQRNQSVIISYVIPPMHPFLLAIVVRIIIL